MVDRGLGLRERSVSRRIADTADGDGAASFLQEDAMVADAGPEKAVEFAGQWPDAASAGFRVALNLLKNGTWQMCWERRGD